MSTERHIARLKTTASTLQRLNEGLIGYNCRHYRPCYLALADGSGIVISVIGMSAAFKFECFSLALDVAPISIETVTPFLGQKGDTLTSILVREEYVSAAGAGTPTVGQDPWVQAAVKPGHVPANAMMTCLAAYGVLIEGTEDRLVVAADWAPFNIVATTDETKISEFLNESEVMPVPRYIQRYGFLESH